MKAQRAFEVFATTINEQDVRLGKTSDRCFHIGIGGGCGLRCAAFCDGECENPYEFSRESIFKEFNSSELKQILEQYPKFNRSNQRA